MEADLSYTPHPAAGAFPMMDGARFESLKEDIRLNGQRLPIVICDNMILDGRNRHKACAALGVEPRYEQYTGNPWAYVWSLNGARRDLTDAQRALIWRDISEQSGAWQEERKAVADKIEQERRAKIADATTEQHKISNPRAGEVMDVVPKEPGSDPHKTRAYEAEAAHVHPSTLAKADALRKARPDLAAKVKAGEMSLADAKKEQRKEDVLLKIEDQGTRPPNLNGKYRVVYADPPWWYATEQHCGASQETTIGTHYPSMHTEDICALPVLDMLEDDAVCFLWATSPLLEHGLRVISAWGFKYKASMVWDKVKHNVGHYVSVRHEFLLIGTRGKCTPDIRRLHDSVYTEERTVHSRKPDYFRSFIDEIYPIGARVELFAREKSSGWDSWGNQL